MNEHPIIDVSNLLRRSTQAATLLVTFLAWAATADLVYAQPRHPILEIRVNDPAGEPVPCRIHLFDSDNKPFRPFELPFWHDHFICSGRAGFEIPSGQYRYEVERGPEHERLTGKIIVRPDAANRLTLTLHRIANLRDSGWYSGDLHVHRPVEQIEWLMRAEDLDFAPVITWWNARNAWESVDPPEQTTRTFDGHRLYNVMAGEDEREGGALLYFGLPRPLDIAAINRELPSPLQFVSAAKKINSEVWIDIEKPFWWDVPVWLASGQMNSIGIANNHMCRSSMLANEAWGRSRDTGRLPSPRGNGFWTQEIYYHMLNCGIELPPSAGSASGVLPNPVGYNRVYVHLPKGTPLTRDAWYEALRRGNSFVTNGPLLVARADGQLPGSRFELGENDSRPIKLDVSLTSLDPISAIEIIHNGKVTKTIACDSADQKQYAVEIEITEPGWFLVRAIADVDETFRFAATAPWFVGSRSGEARVSSTSAQFFLDWVRERIGRVEANVNDPDQLREVLAPHLQAEAFWRAKWESANAP